MIKYFCEECEHCHIEDELKLYFNKYVKKTFIQCPIPIEDKQMSGCLISKMEIDWSNFTGWCAKNGLPMSKTGT